MLVSVIDVDAADGLLIADSNGDGVITLDEINDVGALLNYGLTTGYYVTMPDTTVVIEGTDAYTEFMSALDEEAAAALVMGYIEEDSNGKFVFTAADAFCDLVNGIFGEVSSTSGYTVLPSISNDELIDLLDNLYAVGSMGSSTYANIFNRLSSDEFNNDIVRLQSNGYVNIHKDFSDYFTDYYFNDSNFLSRAYVLDSGSWTSYRFQSRYCQIYNSGYTDSSGTSNIQFDLSRYSYYVVNNTAYVFDDIQSLLSFYDLNKNAYVSLNSPQSIPALLLDTLNNTDWSNLSNQLWSTFETEVEEAQALGTMPQSQFNEILNNNFSELNDAIGATTEGNLNSSMDLQEILNEITESGERQSSWLAKIYALLETYLAGMVENDPEVESPSDASVVEKLEEQREVLENNAQQQLEQSATQHEEQMEQSQTQHEENKTFFGGVTEFFGSFFDNLVDSIVGIFIPDDETMSGLFDELELFFEETFGFLYYPFDLLTDVFELFTSAESKTVLKFPGFSIMGEKVWDDIEYDLASEPVVVEIFGYVRTGTGALLGFWFINYLRNFFDKRFGGGGN